MKKSFIWLLGVVLFIIIMVWALVPKRKVYRKRKVSSVISRRKTRRKPSVSRGAKRYLKSSRVNKRGSGKKWYYFKGRKTSSSKTWGRWMREARKK